MNCLPIVFFGFISFLSRVHGSSVPTAYTTSQTVRTTITTSASRTTYWACLSAGCSLTATFDITNNCPNQLLAMRVDFLQTDFSAQTTGEWARVSIRSNTVRTCTGMGQGSGPQSWTSGVKCTDVGLKDVVGKSGSFSLGLAVGPSVNCANCGYPQGYDKYQMGAVVFMRCVATTTGLTCPTSPPSLLSWSACPAIIPTTRRPTGQPTPAPTCSRVGLTPLDPSIVNGFTRGYDALSDSASVGKILATPSFSQNKSLVYRGCNTRVPNILQAISSVPSCTWSDVSIGSSYSTYNSFMKSNSQSISVSIGIRDVFEPAFGSLSNTRTSARSFSSTQKSTLYQMYQECFIADVSLVSQSLWSFDSSFLLDLKLLPTTFSTSSASTYQNFWSKYGTHVYTSGRIGGKFEGVFASASCKFENAGYTSSEIQACVGGQIKGIGGSVCLGNSVSQTNRLTVGSAISSTWATVVGGNKNTFRQQIEAFATGSNVFGAFENWLNSLQTSSSIILQGSTLPIHTLLTDLYNSGTHPQINASQLPQGGARFTALKAAYDSFISTRNTAENGATSKLTCPPIAAPPTLRTTSRPSTEPCFKGGSMVRSSVKQSIPVEDAVPMTKVFSPFGSNEIYTSGHFIEDAETTFVELVTVYFLKKVTATPDHFIPILNSNSCDVCLECDWSTMMKKCTRNVVFGDLVGTKEDTYVFIVDGNGRLRLDLVNRNATKKVLERGLYSPVSMTGNLIVDDVLVSVYVSWESTSKWFPAEWIPMVHHLMLMPVRLIYRIPGAPKFFGEFFDEYRLGPAEYPVGTVFMAIAKLTWKWIVTHLEWVSTGLVLLAGCFVYSRG